MFYRKSGSKDFCDILRKIWRIKLSASAAWEFCELAQTGIDVYIPHHKYQVKPHSSLWFSAAYGAAIVHRNHQQNKFSESKVNFRQAINGCKRVPEAVKLAYANIKQKSPSYARNLHLGTFDELPISVLNKGKSTIPPRFNDLEVLSFASDKLKLFAENFSMNSSLENSGNS